MKAIYRFFRRLVGIFIFDPAGLLLAVVTLCLVTTAGGFMTDLNGWWRVVEDNGHFIKIQQQGTDITILGTDASELYGTFANDSMWIYLTDPVPETLIFVYADDTLRGQNEEGMSITLARYIVDLTGWWKTLETSDYTRMEQHGSDLSIWDENGSFMADGTFANDTMFILLPEPWSITLTYVYFADTLRGINPDGQPETLARVGSRLWTPVRCGTIVVDGNPADWPEEFLFAQDPRGDATNGNPVADLDKLYLCHDSIYFYFRIDCVGDAAFPHSGGYNDRYDILMGNYNGQPEYLIRVWNTYSINFRNDITGEETNLEAPGISGPTIEGRIPLDLFGDLQRFQIKAGSSYYDWDFGWDSYDDLSRRGQFVSCLGQRAILTPSPQRAIDAYRIVPLIDTVIIGDLEMYEVSEIDPGSIRINGAIQPSAVTILPEYPEFLGEVIQILFPAAPFIRGYEPMWDSTMQEFVVTGGEPNTAGALSIVGQAPFIGHRSGDANADGLVNIADVMFLVQYAFRAGATPRLIEAADANCDGKVNIGDAVYLAGFIFRGGPAPCHR